jgi:nucleotide-binding universal stress UspA family protein
MSQTETRAAHEPRAAAAGYATLLVHAEPGQRSTRRVALAARLARETGARLIGLAAETFDPATGVDLFSGYAPEAIGFLQEQINADLQSAEQAFRRDAAGAEIEFRSVQAYPSRVLARVARAADLIVVSPRSRLGPALAADVAEVVMHAGRPVLIAPPEARQLSARAVVVAWKDTRESRRAVADALPFLLAAEDVIVHAVCEDEAVDEVKFQADDVVAQLKRHGVRARANVSTSAPEGVAREIARIAALNQADLIVAGAYGHSRVHEWAFGGVTDELIHEPPCCVLMSH